MVTGQFLSQNTMQSELSFTGHILIVRAVPRTYNFASKFSYFLLKTKTCICNVHFGFNSHKCEVLACGFTLHPPGG